MSGNPIAAFRARAAMGIGQAVACELLDSVHSLVRYAHDGRQSFEAQRSWLGNLAAYLGLSPPGSFLSLQQSPVSETLRCFAGDLPSPAPGAGAASAAVEAVQAGRGGSPAGGSEAKRAASEGLGSSQKRNASVGLGPADFAVAIATHHARHGILRATTSARKVGPRFVNTCLGAV
jgi:hypothetical protein